MSEMEDRFLKVFLEVKGKINEIKIMEQGNEYGKYNNFLILICFIFEIEIKIEQKEYQI